MIIIGLSLGSTCQEAEKHSLEAGMIAFDKAYIPVLYYTLRGEMSQAKQASFFLRSTWESFESKFQKINKADEDWQEHFRMMSAWLQDAVVAIERNAPQDSYMFLDHVRYQLMELRAQQKLDYFLDKLWDFEVSVGMVVAQVNGQMSCFQDFCEFEDLVDEVNFAWHQIAHAKLELATFGMEESAWENLLQQQLNLKRSVVYFNQAVLDGTERDLLAATTALSNAYLDFLFCFGDFSSAQSYFVKM